MVTWQICAVWGAPGVGPCLLGPILFLLCTADLLRRVRLPSGAACLCGLDDLRICNKCGPAVVYLQDGVSACMGDVACWTAADQLRLSCTGSEVLIVWGSIPCRALLTLIQALVVSKVDYCNSVLTGSWRVQHPAKTVAVRIECCWTAGILGQKVRTHHSVTLLTPLVESSREDKVLALCSGFPMPSWFSATVPRRDFASDNQP